MKLDTLFRPLDQVLDATFTARNFQFSLPLTKTEPARIDVAFRERNYSIPCKFGTSLQVFPSGFGQIQYVTKVDADYYEGEYNVRPKLTAQTLETAKKYMSQNVEVEEIPIYVVSNNSGGKTVVIG